jgi:hypothetical protein
VLARPLNPRVVDKTQELFDQQSAQLCLSHRSSALPRGTTRSHFTLACQDHRITDRFHARFDAIALPLAPGAMKRLWEKFGTASSLDAINDSLARLEDAHTCFDHGLWRPAVVLLGLAFEELLVVTAQRLNVTSKSNAKDRLDELRKAIENHKNGDAKTAALNAMNVADSIRNARNSAAHKASSTCAALEVDELLADGMRAYPKIAGYVPTP